MKAKALDDEPGSGESRNSPTLSLAATRLGVILGTAADRPSEPANVPGRERGGDSGGSDSAQPSS